MKRALALTIVLLLAAPSALAEEIQFGWRTEMEYDSELISFQGGEDDFIFTMGPVTRIEGEHQRFGYDLEHFSGYEKYGDLDELDDWRHEIRGSAYFNLSPRARWDVSNSFQELPSVRAGVNDGLGPDDPDFDPDVVPDDARNVDSRTVRTNVFTTSLSLAPTARLTTTSQFTNIWRNYDDPTLNNQDTLSSTLLNQLQYRVRENHSVGAGFRYSSRDFETGVTDDNETDLFEAFATWIWDIDGRSTFNARLGPSWSSDEKEDLGLPTTDRFPQNATGQFLDYQTCPRLFTGGGAVPVVLPACQGLGQPALSDADQDVVDSISNVTIDAFTPDNDQNDVNLFFAFTLDRVWDRADVSASWIRTDSQTQALGSATILDSFLLRSGYRITPRLRLSGTFRFTRRFSDVERDDLLLVLREAFVPVPGVSVPTLASEVIDARTFDTSFEQTIDSFNVQLRALYDWGRYSTAFASVSFHSQDNELDSELDGLDQTNDTNNWQFLMGFTYRFQPVRF